MALWKKSQNPLEPNNATPQRLNSSLGSMSSVKFMRMPENPLRCSRIICNLSWRIPSIMV